MCAPKLSGPKNATGFHEPYSQILFAHRSPEIEALQIVTAHLDYEPCMLDGFDTLGNNLHSKAFPNADDGFSEKFRALVRYNRLDEVAINL